MPRTSMNGWEGVGLIMSMSVLIQLNIKYNSKIVKLDDN